MRLFTLTECLLRILDGHVMVSVNTLRVLAPEGAKELRAHVCNDAFRKTVELPDVIN